MSLVRLAGSSEALLKTIKPPLALAARAMDARGNILGNIKPVISEGFVVRGGRRGLGWSAAPTDADGARAPELERGLPCTMFGGKCITRTTWHRGPPLGPQSIVTEPRPSLHHPPLDPRPFSCRLPRRASGWRQRMTFHTARTPSARSTQVR